MLVERLDVAADTHRALLERLEAAGLADRALATLRRLTRIHERATYAPDGVARTEVGWAIRVATRLVDLAQ